MFPSHLRILWSDGIVTGHENHRSCCHNWDTAEGRNRLRPDLNETHAHPVRVVGLGDWKDPEHAKRTCGPYDRPIVATYCPGSRRDVAKAMKRAGLEKGDALSPTPRSFLIGALLRRMADRLRLRK